MKKAYSIVLLFASATFLGARAVQSPSAPSTQPALTAAQQTAMNAISSAFASDAAQIASLSAANVSLQQQVQPWHKGWLATNVPAANYYTSNIHADICQQSSSFYNVGDATPGTLNANGYPIGNAIHMRSQNWLYDVPAGTLNVTWTGTATLKLLVYGPGTWTQTSATSGTLVLPQPGLSATKPANNNPSLVLWIDVTSSLPADPLNNLHIWQPGYGPGTPNAGLMYRTDYTAILAKYAGARFMAAMNSAGSTEVAPADRVLPTGYDQTTRGCCVEDCIELAKEAKLPRAWFCLPAASNAAYQQQVAQLIHDGLPGVEITIEYADEPWNSVGAYYAWSVVNALANTTAIGKYDGTYNTSGQFVPTPSGSPWMTDSLTRCVRAAADLERTMSRNVRPIFADNPSRLKICLSSQAGNSYWASEGLKWINAVYGNTSDFDLIIEAPYFTYWPDNNTTTPTGPNGTYLLSDLAGGVESDFQRYVLPEVQAHTAIAKQYGKLHRLYEAGQTFYPPAGAFTGTDLASQYNYSPEIAKDYALYYFLLRANGVDLCFDFNLGPTWWNQYGFWGTLQSLQTTPTDPTGPTPINWRFQAQMQMCGLWN